MTHSPHRFGWATLSTTVLALAVLPAGDAPRPPRAIDVAYVGTMTAQTDPTFEQFLLAIERLPASRRQGLRVEYWPVRDSGPADALSDLRRPNQAPPEVWVAPTGDSAQAVSWLSPPRPLVFATYPDPLRLGLVRSLSRPGGAATGVSLHDDLHAKRLELLIDAFGPLHRVGVVLDQSWISTRNVNAVLHEPARRLGLALHVFVANDEQQLNELMHDSARVATIQAWYIPPTYLAYRTEAALIAHLARLRKPAIHASESEVAAGALMAYSQNQRFVFDALADLTARVAGGEDPAQIPVQRPMQFVLAVRPRPDTASLRIHPSVIRRADRIY